MSQKSVMKSWKDLGGADVSTNVRFMRPRCKMPKTVAHKHNRGSAPHTGSPHGRDLGFEIRLPQNLNTPPPPAAAGRPPSERRSQSLWGCKLVISLVGGVRGAVPPAFLSVLKGYGGDLFGKVFYRLVEP